MKKSKNRTILLIAFLLIVLVVGIIVLVNLKKDSGSKNTILSAELTPIVVDYKKDEIQTYESYAAVTLYSNKELIVPDTIKTAKLFFTKTSEKWNYIYVLEAGGLTVGIYPTSVILQDKQGQKVSIDLKINRVAYTLPFGIKQIDNWDGYQYSSNGNDLNVQVDKAHKLPIDFVPEDLVDINKDLYLYTNASGFMIRREAGDKLKIMLSDLKKATGKDVVIASAYRSYNDQLKLYSNWVKQLNQDEADKVSARPGFSEHQLGTVIDFIDQDSGLQLVNEFETTTAGAWIKENSYKYGFLQSYPEGKEAATRYSHEAWHYRYVGEDLAQKVHDKGVTLIEYLNSNQ